MRKYVRRIWLIITAAFTQVVTPDGEVDFSQATRAEAYKESMPLS